MRLVSVTIAVPGARYWPTSTCLMPSRPVNGARTIFSAISACWASTCAFATFRLAASVSTVAWAIALAAS